MPKLGTPKCPNCKCNEWSVEQDIRDRWLSDYFVCNNCYTRLSTEDYDDLKVKQKVKNNDGVVTYMRS